ncbi:glycosyltransferase family 1 protein, partial [Lacticaseibacillus paracasei]
MKPAKTKFSDAPDGSIHQYDQILKYFNDQPADQTKPRGNRITFVTTGIIGFDGGQTTMLHLGTLLANAGYDVYYLSYVPQSQDEMIQNAEFNYPGYKGTCLPMGELESHRSDIWVATLWESVYVIKNKPGYKMYFVQDYEPYFYPYGDRYQMARRTYSLGLHMVSLGPWCAHMITMHCKVHSPIDVINFPVDVARYPFKERDMGPYEQKKQIKLAVYTKWSSPRRAPINIQIVLENCRQLLRAKGIDLKIQYFGTDRSKRFINGENLGKLTPPELNRLYQSADFGIAPSMTNFSLVPYEMMSTGLPLIDFKEGTGSYF